RPLMRSVCVLCACLFFVFCSSDAHRHLHSFPTRRSSDLIDAKVGSAGWEKICRAMEAAFRSRQFERGVIDGIAAVSRELAKHFPDRKSTRLNSSHDQISYAVFCLKKKNVQQRERDEIFGI